MAEIMVGVDGSESSATALRWAAQEAVHFAAEGTRARADVVVDGGALGGW